MANPSERIGRAGRLPVRAARIGGGSWGGVRFRGFVLRSVQRDPAGRIGRLAACAAGLVIAWFGVWLSLELGWLWIGRVVFGLGKKVCTEEVADV